MIAKRMNKTYRVPLLYDGAGGGQQFNYLFLPSSAYVDTGIADTNAHLFHLVYTPISLQTSYQNYIASHLDNFTLAFYSSNKNYLRVCGQEISKSINANWNTRIDYTYDSNQNGFASLGNSGENIIINNNTSFNRGGYQKFELLELYTNDDNYLFVPYVTNSEPGLFDLIHNVFIPASGNGAYCE